MAFRDVLRSANTRSFALLRRADFWGIVGVVSGAALLFWLLGAQLAGLLERAEAARSFIHAFGPLAPLAYIALFAMQILIAPFPGQFMAIMSGYLFGVFWGSLYSIVGLAVGAGIAMIVARRYGRPLLERFFSSEQVRLWERKLRMRSPVTWGLLFVFPVPDVVFYVAGLSRVPLRELIIAVITGRSLGLIFANVLGTLSATLPPEWVIIKWLVLAVAAFALYRYQRAIRLAILLSVRRVQQLWRRRRQLWDEKTQLTG